MDVIDAIENLRSSIADSSIAIARSFEARLPNIICCTACPCAANEPKNGKLSLPKRALACGIFAAGYYFTAKSVSHSITTTSIRCTNVD